MARVAFYGKIALITSLSSSTRPSVPYTPVQSVHDVYLIAFSYGVISSRFYFFSSLSPSFRTSFLLHRVWGYVHAAQANRSQGSQHPLQRMWPPVCEKGANENLLISSKLSFCFYLFFFSVFATSKLFQRLSNKYSPSCIAIDIENEHSCSS